MLKLWPLSPVVVVVEAVELLLPLQSLEEDVTMSQSEGQMHAPSSPVQVGLEALTVHEEQTLSLSLQ